MNRFSGLVESKLWNFLMKAVDLMILSFWWVIGSLLIVTAGAASTALYHAVHKTVWLDEGRPTKDFWLAYKASFKQSTLASLWFLLAAAFAVYAWLFAAYIGKDTFLGTFYQVVVCVIAVIGVILALYIFPLISRYSMKIKSFFAAAFSLAITHFLRTLVMLILAGICVLGILAMPPTVLILPGLYMFSVERVTEPVLKKLLPKEAE